MSHDVKAKRNLLYRHIWYVILPSVSIVTLSCFDVCSVKILYSNLKIFMKCLVFQRCAYTHSHVFYETTSPDTRTPVYVASSIYVRSDGIVTRAFFGRYIVSLPPNCPHFIWHNSGKSHSQWMRSRSGYRLPVPTSTFIFLEAHCLQNANGTDRLCSAACGFLGFDKCDCHISKILICVLANHGDNVRESTDCIYSIHHWYSCNDMCLNTRIRFDNRVVENCMGKSVFF